MKRSSDTWTSACGDLEDYDSPKLRSDDIDLFLSMKVSCYYLRLLIEQRGTNYEYDWKALMLANLKNTIKVLERDIK